MTCWASIEQLLSVLILMATFFKAKLYSPPLQRTGSCASILVKRTRSELRYSCLAIKFGGGE
jgi:hypothetical protein